MPYLGKDHIMRIIDTIRQAIESTDSVSCSIPFYDGTALKWAREEQEVSFSPIAERRAWNPLETAFDTRASSGERVHVVSNGDNGAEVTVLAEDEPVGSRMFNIANYRTADDLAADVLDFIRRTISRR